MSSTRYVQTASREIWWQVAAVVASLIAVLMLSRMAGGVASMPVPEEPPRTVQVVSPWHGLFLASEYPGGAPYVVVGDRVTPNMVVGLIEVLPPES